MKNKKGFTLVELIAVIVLLAVLSTLGVLSIASISSQIKQRQRSNLVASLKLQAKKYVNDTGMKKVYIDTLIKEGYVASDKVVTTSVPSEQVIYDPKDNSKTLNCYYFDFSTNNDGVFIDEETIDELTGECSTDIFLDSVIVIKYCEKESCANSELKNFYETNGKLKWIRQNKVVLYATTSEKGVISQEDINDGAVWTTPLAPDISTKISRYVLEVPSGYLETTYQVRVTKSDKDYTANQLIKIDANDPLITSLKIDKATEYTAKKYVYMDLEDKESGLAGYIIKKSSEPLKDTDTWVTVTGKVANISSNNAGNEIAENGSYTIYVKDIAGNISEGREFEITTIDNESPICTHSGDNTSWTKNEVPITWSCTDNGGSCSINLVVGSEVYNQANGVTITYKDKEQVTVNYIVTDAAGNSATCTEKANVYSDTKGPTCSIDVNGVLSDTGWYKDHEVTLTLSKDDEVGSIKRYGLVNSNIETYNNIQTATQGNTTGVTWYGYVEDEAGNKGTCQTEIIKVNTEKPTCEIQIDGVVGDNNWYKERAVILNLVTQETGSTITEYGIANTSVVSYNGNTSATQGNTTGVKWYGYVKDESGNTGTCKTGTIKVDKTAPTCTVTKSGTEGENGWYRSKNVTLSLTKSDTGGSTLEKHGLIDSSTVTYNSKTSGSQGNTSGVTWYGYVKDKAGNTGTCDSGVIKVDKTAPTVSAFTINKRSSYSYNSMYAKYSITGDDSNSGVSSACFTDKNDFSGCTWKSVNSNNVYGANVTFGSSEGTGTKYTRYAYVKDKAGNISKSSSASYTLYKECGETTSSESGWSECSVTCGGGTQTKTITKNDKYLGSKCPTDTISQDCNTQECCKETYECLGATLWKKCGDEFKESVKDANGKAISCTLYCTDPSACSKPCGEGITTRECYYHYNNKYKSESWDDWDYCNTSACKLSNFFKAQGSVKNLDGEYYWDCTVSSHKKQKKYNNHKHNEYYYVYYCLKNAPFNRNYCFDEDEMIDMGFKDSDIQKRRCPSNKPNYNIKPPNTWAVLEGW